MLTRPILGTLSYLFMGVGAVILVWCGFLLLQAHVYQTREKDRFVSALRESKSISSPPKFQKDSVGQPIPMNGALLGELEIPRLGIDTMIFQGDDTQVLRWGAGHIPNTPLLDAPKGNVGLAAHRDSYFRPLRRIHRNDLIIVKTPHGDHRYQVQSTKIVSPDDVAVLDSTGQRMLTLVTCYPFYYIGPAPKRFIVQARAISSRSDTGD